MTLFRQGLSTGSCAAAAAKAATRALVLGQQQEDVTIRLPDGSRERLVVTRVIVRATEAEAAVVKDGGDDPDVTHRSEIVARVRRRLGHVPRNVPLDDRVVDLPLLNSHDEHLTLSARVDQILRKISREGLDSLTDEERQILDDASEKYRTRT